jgi:hypothetical protein
MAGKIGLSLATGSFPAALHTPASDCPGGGTNNTTPRRTLIRATIRIRRTPAPRRWPMGDLSLLGVKQ